MGLARALPALRGRRRRRLYLRTRVSESPEFEAARERGEVHTGLPVAILVTKYRRAVLLGTLGVMAPLFIQSLLAVFMSRTSSRRASSPARPRCTCSH